MYVKNIQQFEIFPEEISMVSASDTELILPYKGLVPAKYTNVFVKAKITQDFRVFLYFISDGFKSQIVAAPKEIVTFLDRMFYSRSNEDAGVSAYRWGIYTASYTAYRIMVTNVKDVFISAARIHKDDLDPMSDDFLNAIEIVKSEPERLYF